MSRNRSGEISQQKFLFNSLDIFALWSLAVAQPLFSLISQNGTFLVAHDCGPIEILVFVLVLILVLPACLVLVEGVFRLINRYSYRIFHYFLIFCLVVLLALFPLKKVAAFHDIAILSAAAGVGLIFLFAHIRFPVIRKMLRVCSLSVLLFSFVFIWSGQPRELIFSKEESTQFHVDPTGKPPIVMVLFDEIASPYLQDEEGRIDALRYPNFAALASGSYWFPNALSVSDNTYQGVPAILTGQYYTKVGYRGRLPALVDYPHNLFTLLDGAYVMNVIETATKLSPVDYRGIGSFLGEKLPLYSGLFVDTGIVYLNMVAPPGIGSRLPDVTQNWEGFLDKARLKSKNVDAEKIFGGKWAEFFVSNQKTRAKTFRNFISSIKLSERPVLNFLDIGIPHRPMEYYPSGKRYSGSNPALLENRWPEDDWYVKGRFQRYMLQLGFTDTLLGELIEGLKKSGVYDKCLLVVTADHGVSYRPGDKRRTCQETNFIDLMSIPLFIKLPDQAKGIVDPRYVQSIDIVPSIASAIGIQIPWNVDGSSLFSPQYQEKSLFRLRSHKEPAEWSFKKTDVVKQLDELRRRTLSIFGSGSSKPNGLFAIGPHEELLGKIPGTDVSVRNGPLKTKVTEQLFFDDLDLTWDVLPLFVSGRIETTPADINPPEVLAICLNNRVWATTRLSNNNDFVAMLPEEALMQGKNDIEVLGIISSEDAGVYLVRGEGSDQADMGKYVLEEGAILHTDEQKRYFIVPYRLKLYLDSVTRHSNYTEFVGWAADHRNSKLVDNVIVFADGQSVYVTPTTDSRSDVARFHKDDNLTLSGFRFLLPNDLMEKDIRLFVISEDVATEAQYPKDSGLVKVRFSPVIDTYLLEGDVITHRETKEKWFVKPYAFKVYVEKAEKKEDHIEFVGWAVDIRENKLLDKIIVFAKGHSVYASATNVFRIDVAEWHKNENFLRSGFRFFAPEKGMSNIRIFGIAGQTATEANYPKDYRFN